MIRSIRFPSLHTISSAGAVLPPDLLTAARNALCSNVVGAYGSSEAGAAARAPSHILERYPGAAGFVEPGMEVQLVDVNDQPVAPGNEGIV